VGQANHSRPYCSLAKRSIYTQFLHSRQTPLIVHAKQPPPSASDKRNTYGPVHAPTSAQAAFRCMTPKNDTQRCRATEQRQQGLCPMTDKANTAKKVTQRGVNLYTPLPHTPDMIQHGDKIVMPKLLLLSATLAALHKATRPRGKPSQPSAAADCTMPVSWLYPDHLNTTQTRPETWPPLHGASVVQQACVAAASL
jgi:hypothetical protein